MSRVEWKYEAWLDQDLAKLGDNCQLHVDKLHPQLPEPFEWYVTIVRYKGHAKTLEEAKRAAEDALADLLRETGEKLKELREGREEQE